MRQSITSEILRASLAMFGVVALAQLLVTPATAAVRRCEANITHVGTSKASELDARRNALTAWSSAANVLGTPYALWRLASDPSIVCTRGAASEHLCTASAKPCALIQNPNNPPPVNRVVPGSAPIAPIAPVVKSAS